MPPRIAPRLAHALLIHGERLGSGQLSQSQFWEIAQISRSGGPVAAKKFETLGRYFVKPDREPPRLGPGLGVVLGISIGTESLRGALVDVNGQVHCAAEARPRPRRTRQMPENLLSDIQQLAGEVLKLARDEPELLAPGGSRGVLPLLGVATAWPTPVHRYTKLPVGKALHRQWQSGDSLPKRVATKLGVPPERSHALNDANALALAVAFDETRRGGAPTDAHDDRAQTLLVLRVGGGIGAGTVGLEAYDGKRCAFLESRLIEGAKGTAGEIGHLRLPNELLLGLESEEESEQDLAPLNPRWPCSCGETMHLEALASGAALVRRIDETHALALPNGLRKGQRRGEKSAMPEIMSALSDSRALEAVKDAGRLIGHALASPILMLSPTKVVIGGSLATPQLIEGIEDAKTSWMSKFGPDPLIRALDPRRSRFEVARGAALAVFREQVYRQFDHLFLDPRALRGLTWGLSL